MSVAVRKSKANELKQFSGQSSRPEAGQPDHVKIRHTSAAKSDVTINFASDLDILEFFNEKTQGFSTVVRQECARRLLNATQKIAEKEGLRFIPAIVTDQPMAGSDRIPNANRKFMDKMAAQSGAARDRDLAEGRLLPAAMACAKLEITKQAVSKAVKEHRMFTLDGPSGESLYPAFFADKRYDRRTLGKISKALGGLPGPSKWQFFTTGKASLCGKTPLDALSDGELDAVLAAAAGFVDR